MRNKWLQIMLITILLISQLVIGPIGTVTAESLDVLSEDLVVEQMDTENVVDTTDKHKVPTSTSIQDSEEERHLNANTSENLSNHTKKEEKQEELPALKEEESATEISDDDFTSAKAGAIKEEKKEQDLKIASTKTNQSQTTNKTGFHLVLDKATQGPEDEPFTEENPLNPMDEFNVHYSFNMSNDHNYKAGDKFIFDLPKQLNILKEIKDELWGINQSTLEEVKFADYTISSDGKVTIIFTDAVENISEINGGFYFKSKLNPSQTEIEDGKVTIGPMAEGGSLEIPVNTGEMAANISKVGTPLPAFSPKEVEWTITVDSKMLKHKDGKVTDMLPPGLTYKPGSITINGEQAAEPTIDGQNLDIALGDFSGTKTITFITTIDQENWSDKAFYNKATYEADKVSPIEAGASVTINRGNPLVKKPGSYDSKTRTITWTIEMNYDSQDLVNTTLVDTWDAGSMDFVEGSVEVSEMKLDEKGKASLVGVSDIPKTVTPSANGITIDFPKVDKPYKITYQTKLKERPTQNSEIINNVSWNGHEDKNKVSVTQGVLTKHVGAPNYKDKTVKWWFKANSDRQELKNIVLSDKFATPGLTMKENSLVVKVGNKVIAADNYTVQYNVDGQAFVLTFNPEFKTNQEIIVEFETHFDYAALKAAGQTEFKNTGKITSTDYEGNKHKDREAYQVLPMDDFTKHDGNKSGYYDARDKTITWTIVVNYQQNKYEELIVKDLIQGNQKLLPETIKVSEAILSGGANNKPHGNAENIKPDEEPKGNINLLDKEGHALEKDENPAGFIVNLGETNKPYVIEYKTSLEGLDYIEKSYENTANVFDGTTKLTDLPADVGITQGGKYGGKTGEQNGKAIDWTVTVNASQAKVQDVVLTDTLSANQEFLQETIKVYATTVDNFGNVTKGAAYDNVKINVTEEAPQTLTVTFNDEIDRPYIVEYSTLYFAGDKEIVSNKYKVTGSNIGDKGEQGGNESVEIDQSSGGFISGKTGYLQINKIASDDENKALEGIEFQLIDEKTGKILKTGITDEYGKIDFGRLIYGNYLLKETKAPEGYLTPTEAYKVTINKEYVKGDTEKIGNVETIINHKEIKQIEIGKNEPGGSWLAGAEFMIKDDKGEVVEENLVTDANGKVTSKELPVGTYKLVETKAPEGYNKLTEPIEFKIEAGKTEPVVRDVLNYKLADLKVKKVEKGQREVLKGVKFTLKRTDASEQPNRIEFTDDKGIALFKDLPDGEYELEETKTLPGYIKSDTKKVFKIDNGEIKEDNTPLQNSTITIENEFSHIPVKLIKKDRSGRLLEGAEFDLYKVDAESNNLVKHGSYTSNSKGEVEVLNLKEEGNYYFIETKAPNGYQLDKEKYEFEAKKGEVIELEIYNERIPTPIYKGSAQLTKVDAESNYPLAGAVFKLVNAKGEVVKEGLTTDENGQLRVDDLDLGQYFFVETKAPTGYVLDESPHAVGVYIGKGHITVKNEQQKGAVELVKVDALNSEKTLANAEFKLVDSQGQVVQDNLVTNSEGRIVVEGLKLGDYFFIETKAPTGYVLNSDPLKVTIQSDELVKVTKENEPSTGELQVTKIDGKEETLLAGAIFKVVDENGVLVKDNLVTDEDGLISLTDLKVGYYTLIETKAPSGYRLSKEQVNFEIVSDEVTTVTFKNYQIKGPNEGEEGEGIENPENPDHPTTPEEGPNEEENPAEVDKDKNPGNHSSNKPGNLLPQTGEEYFIFSLVTGFVLIALGGLLVRGRRKES